ncbi:MAG: hypothetical protein ACJ735_02115 [Actinomycetes bacterium]
MLVPLVSAALISASGVAISQTQTAGQAWTGLRAGVGVVDATWHVGAGAGQYASDEFPTDPTEPDKFISYRPDLQTEWDPNVEHVKQQSSYGVASRLSIRAIVLQDGEGDAPVALVKTDNYLTQDLLVRRAAQILKKDGSKVSYDNLLVSATHDHNSPYYSSTAFGVWAFQDVADLRMFEYQARQIATAVERAEGTLRPARIGGTTVQFPDFQGNIAGSGVNEDGSPTGYPMWENDHGLVVLRIDDMSDANSPKPLATYVNYAEHGESLDGYDLISADWLAPFQRYVDRATGAPVVFSQGSVGSAEGPYEYANPKQGNDEGDSFNEIYGHMGYAQAERGTHVMAERVVAAWQAIGGAANGVTVQAPFDTNPTVRMLTRWYAGPLSHPYPSVGNCRTGPTAGGDPGVPGVGLPNCARSDDIGLTLPISPRLYDQLKATGIPVPDNYDVPSHEAVEENLRLKLQALRIGSILLASCACEPQSDLIKNLETRTDRVTGDMWLGFDYGNQADVDAAWPGMGVLACHLDLAAAPPAFSCPNPGDRWGQQRLSVSPSAYKHMEAEITNDAAGWNAPGYVDRADSEPSNPAAIKGNFTHTELGKGAYAQCPGYALSVGLGHSSDYNGYTVSYREYMSRDAYRKALTSYGPHTADYMVTNLVGMAANLLCGTRVPSQPTDAIATADEVRETAEAAAVGQIAAAYYYAWTKQIPDSAGPARDLAQPWNVQRFDVTQFRWVGGDNWTDNPTVAVERLGDGSWQPFADQSGEVQVFLDTPRDAVHMTPTYRGGSQQWNWRASFEAFDAYPRADVVGGQTPTGTYRFVVNGHIHTSRAVRAYHLTSGPFTVSPWSGITVNEVQRSGDQISFAVSDTYPRLPSAAHRARIRWYADDGGGTPGHSLICKTCSFEPWSTSGHVVSVTVSVDGTPVDAAYDASSGRWTVIAPAGATVAIPAGGISDSYDETNGSAADLSG